MGGGLMQLVAYGAQDIYLTGNPQITFFKVVYRRHTNFSMESIEQTWSGNSGGATAARCTSTISRNGDLVHKMYLELVGTFDAVLNPGTIGIDDVELEIGGQKIDKHTGQWMETWNQLTQPNPGNVGGQIGNGHTTANNQATTFQLMSGSGGVVGVGTVASRIFVPLQFWFNRNPGLALPLIALQYHEVKVILNHTWDNGFNTAATCALWCDYIYLDTDERRRFAQVSHEYLIEQVQEQTLTTPTGSNDLNFNHPVKELIWVLFSLGNPVLAGSTGADDPAETYQLKLNGHDRFAARHWTYFTKVQVNQYHSGSSGVVGNDPDTISCNPIQGICVYSFALKPEEHQPSGTCNFSRIDNAQLVGTTGCAPDTIYAVNYNVLRIMSGMGGLAYSN